MWEKYSEIIIAIIAMLSSLSTIYLSHFLNERKKNKEDVVVNSFEGDRAVLDKLGELLDEFDADRTYINEFHNGGKFYTGRSMQKFSMTYEVCRHGVSHEHDNFQNVLLSTWNDFIKIIIEKKSVIISDIETYTECDRTKDIFLNKGCLSVYVLPIYDLNNKLIGMLTLDYTRKKRILSNLEVEKIRMIGNILSGYL